MSPEPATPLSNPKYSGKKKTFEELNIGVIGAGSFAEFSVNSFKKIKGIEIIAVTDLNQQAAFKLGNKHGAIVYPDPETLLENKRIDLIYIATPPSFHFEQTKLALLAGKHVICEKPAALTTEDAEELYSLASSKQLLYVVNLMQRYNPLFKAVDVLIKHKVLGNFLHGYFENYASDENLLPSHWFWDESKSGGIFIEHGVHFFDLFSGWLGKGKVLSSVQISRPGIEEKIVDRVQATVLYEEGLVNFYHGFDQPNILDRQEMRLQFERGEITLNGWIPVKMVFHGLIKRDQFYLLKEHMSGSLAMYEDENPSTGKKVTGRFREIYFDYEVTLSTGDISDKQPRYTQLLTEMLSDQWNWIKDHTHLRVIDGSNAVESLRMAEQASKISQKF